MPKRSFNRRVLNVIRQDQETKHVVQTREFYSKNASPDTLVAVSDNTLDAQGNVWCWSISHDTAKFWPLNLVACKQGTGSGHDGGLDSAKRDADTRIGIH